MEKMIGGENEYAKRIFQIEALLREAQNTAVTKETAMGLMAERDALDNLERTNETTERLLEIGHELQKHTIVVSSISEYKTLLEKAGLEAEKVTEVIAHENAHANKAESVGAMFGGYALLVYKSENSFGYIPAALTNTDFIFDPIEKLAAEKDIATAPEDYQESPLSDADKNRIDYLNTKE